MTSSGGDTPFGAARGAGVSRRGRERGDDESGMRGVQALHEVRRVQADRLLAEVARWQARLQRQHESRALLRRMFEDAAQTDEGRLVGALARNRLAHRLQLLSLLGQADQAIATTRSQVDTSRALWQAGERQCALWARLRAMRDEACAARHARAEQRVDDEAAARQWARGKSADEGDRANRSHRLREKG
ncbi:flagellar export protein FliJ [Chitinasiproducens palmae]|nr:hypothetical protein [Chitinasiproducens palmae]